MEIPRTAGGGEPAPSFIGSYRDGADQATIVLRGAVSAPMVARLGLHVEDCLVDGTRFLTVEAAAVTSYEAPLLDLLVRTQRRLGARQGMVRVRGLRPGRLRPQLPPVSGTAPSEAGSVPELAGCGPVEAACRVRVHS